MYRFSRGFASAAQGWSDKTYAGLILGLDDHAGKVFGEGGAVIAQQSLRSASARAWPGARGSKGAGGSS